MSLSYRVVSIGALSRNRLWGETEPRRAGHATVTVVRSGGTTILVDPSLPAELLRARLDERLGIGPDAVDVVFLTTFRPVHRRGLTLFERASWLMHEPEIEGMREHLEAMSARLDGTEGGEDDVGRLVADELALLKRFSPASDKLTGAVHLYPLVGASRGSAGLLLAVSSRTILIAGDAVLTQDHYESGQVFEQSVDVESARSALRDVMEVADEIVPGHDNAFAVWGR